MRRIGLSKAMPSFPLNFVADFYSWGENVSIWVCWCSLGRFHLRSSSCSGHQHAQYPGRSGEGSGLGAARKCFQPTNCAFRRSLHLGDPTMFRIERVTDGRSTVLKLSGRIDEDHLAQLHSEIEKSGDVSKLDLRDVNLVDRSSVRFLMQCDSQGIQLVNCSLYIQEWISRERRRADSRDDNE